MTLYVCRVHGRMIDGVFEHAGGWYCRHCFDANPRAAYAPVEPVEYVPRPLAVELAEALEAAEPHVKSMWTLAKVEGALSKAREAGLLVDDS